MTGATLQGRRVPDDTPLTEMRPGDYARFDGAWLAWAPGRPDLVANLGNHDVTEHEDGTITVSPSILVRRGEAEVWHGYLERGVWRSV